MKKALSILTYLTILQTSYAQQFYFNASADKPQQLAVIDSMQYVKVHSNIKSVTDHAQTFLDRLKKTGYLSAELTSLAKINDSTFSGNYHLGLKTVFLHIYIGKDAELKKLVFADVQSDTISIPFAESEAFMTKTLSTLERKGYSLAKINLIDINSLGRSLYAGLAIDIGKRRQVNDIVIVGYEKFPQGHRKNINRLYKGKIFNQGTLDDIDRDFRKFRFVNQSKYPEILFKSDTTKVYVYLEKAKANRFDGFIGFSNDEQQKITFNGYLDLLLVNILNIGESFSLYWKSDGNEQTSFDASIELPYIFRSPFALKANLNIFKQDSTFQNTKTATSLGYYLNYNTRLYLGYESTESSDIQNQNTATVSDFKSSFVTSSFEYTSFNSDDFLFPETTRAIISAGAGSRNTVTGKDAQYFVSADLMHTLYLNSKNSINIRTSNYYLKSDRYIIGELHRFGGINSIRGFNENSLQANILMSVMSEYRYRIASGLYAHSIIDYGYFEDSSGSSGITRDGTLLGLGFGFGLLTKNGLFNIIYANGSADQQTITLSNSIIHISFKTIF